MVCPTCGAELRATARFCNRCGTRIAPPADPATQTARAAPASASANAPAGASTGAQAGGIVAPARPQAATITTQLDKAQLEMSPTLVLPAGQAAPAGARTTVPVPPNAGASGRYGAPAHPSGPLAAGYAHQPDDQLPWPLVIGIILDGRYRVEDIVHAGDGENAYAVTDLRGYEQCWACGQVYGPAAASERYCRECGADLLARELIMAERLLQPGEQPAAPDAEADVRRFIQSGRLYEIRPKVMRHPSFPLGARLVAGAASDAGRARAGEANEDSALVIVLDRVHESRTLPLGVFAVADGLGGHASGNRASRQAIHVIAHTILRQLALPLVGLPSDPAFDEAAISDLLVEAVREANLALCANNKESGQDAGSTLVAALVLGETAYLANVGDSRGYVLDQTGFRRITSDHSLVQQLVAGGLIAPDEVYTHPQRNQIFRSLGDDPDLVVDVYVQQLSPSMRFLLCSDGLWEMVRDEQIEALLRSDRNPQAICDDLIAAANAGGGEDNITAVVIEVG